MVDNICSGLWPPIIMTSKKMIRSGIGLNETPLVSCSPSCCVVAAVLSIMLCFTQFRTRFDSRRRPHCFWLDAIECRTIELRTHQSSTKEHYRNRHMFQILSSPHLSPSCEMLQKDFGGAIRKYKSGFKKLSRHSAGASGLQVPGPSEICPTAHVSTQDNETLPKEYATLDEMR